MTLALARAPGGATEAAASAARSVGLVAQAVEFFRGSRVEDYGPLVELATRLCAGLHAPADPNLDPASPAPGEAEGKDGAGEPAGVQPATSAGEAGGDREGGGYPGNSLSGQALRLVAAIVAGRGKGVGASGGLDALADVAPCWAPALAGAPAGEALTLARSLIRPPGGGPAAAALFSAELLGVAARPLLAIIDTPERARPGTVIPKSEAPDAGLREEALGLLVEACAALQPGVRARARHSLRCIDRNAQGPPSMIVPCVGGLLRPFSLRHQRGST